ncbi:MAG: nitroreductase family protein [Candidatus Latescibacterota bacterium]
MKKKAVVTVSLIIFFLSAAYAQTNANRVIDVILSSYSQRTFTTQQVTDGEIDQIIRCGIKAPSARNKQPWNFTIVKDAALCKKIISNITDGNVIIVISGPDTLAASIDFDCALATENMFIAAQALGLGSRIYTGPVNNVNATLKESLGIPAGYRVIALLRIGNIDKTVDAVSAASKRKDAKEIVNTR